MKNPLVIFLSILGCYFSFLTANAANFYWVGGSGNWSDYANHWATTSGGNVFQLRVPNLLDNVYFDANSFTAPGQTVTIDTSAANCGNMDWTGAMNNPTFAASDISVQLKIYGSLQLNSSMNFAFDAKLFFSAVSLGKTITTSGITLPCPIAFNGPGGEWTLQDSLTTSSSITLNYGTLRTNNQDMNALYFNSTNTNTRALYLGTSTVTLTGAQDGTAYVWQSAWAVSRSLILDADSSIIKMQSSAGFYSEDLAYNVIKWEAFIPIVTYYINFDMYSDSIRVKKVICDITSNYSSYVSLSMKALNSTSIQIDTIISNISIGITGSGNNIQYIYSTPGVSVGNEHVNDLNSTVNTIVAGTGVRLRGADVDTIVTGGNLTTLDYWTTTNVTNSIGVATVGGKATLDGVNTIGVLTVGGNSDFTGINDIGICQISGNVNFLENDNHFGILTLKEGNTFTFGAGKTQTIDSLILIGNPGFPTTLVSSDIGIPANVVINSPLCADNLFIQAVHASGSSALYVGANSVDIANNAGWIFADCSCYITGNDLICANDSTSFIATGGVTYSWSGPSGFTANTANTGTINIAGVYTVTVTDSLGDTSSCSRTLTVFPVCDDFDACTTDGCNPSTGCAHFPIACADGDVCTVDGCDTLTGCIYTPVCYDGDVCTMDSCQNGVCSFTSIPGCNNPCDTISCDDGDVCTTDSCRNGSCLFAAIPGCRNICDTLVCNDFDACTTNGCDSLAGCIFPSIICDDGDACTTDGCDLLSGCTSNITFCDDGDLCTADACNPLTGCIYNSIVLNISFTTTHATCSTCYDGSATVQVSNGTAPFIYTWFTSPIQTTQTAINLSPGDYALCMSDANGCSSCDTVTILSHNCSAHFDLYPDTVPHQYYAVNMAAGTGFLTYSWNWGDGSTDTSAYPSHTYATAGLYTICLTITDSSGCSDTYCNPYFLLKAEDESSAMIQVNVVPPTFTGLHGAVQENFTFYPNPTTGTVTLKGSNIRGSAVCTLLDAMGKQLIRKYFANGVLAAGVPLDLSALHAGLYFLKIQTGNGCRILKVVKE